MHTTIVLHSTVFCLGIIFLADTKSSIENGEDSVLGTGDVITHKVTITNTGTTCIYQLELTDALNTDMVCQPSYTGERHT